MVRIWFELQSLETSSCMPAQLEELTLGVAPSTNEWGLIGPVAMTYSSATHTLPETWAGLQRLRRMALRGHTLLRALPDWLPLCGI